MRPSSRCASRANQPPRPTAAAVYGQSMPYAPATGHSSSDTATVSQLQATVCRPTDSGVATTGSIGTSARA